MQSQKSEVLRILIYTRLKINRKYIFVQVSSTEACFISKIQQFELPSFHSAWHQKKNAISLKKVSPLDFQHFNHFKYYKICLCASMIVLEWKGGAFIEKVNSRCFCWFPAAILYIWRLHTKLYKGAWNVSATNSGTVGHKDLRFGHIVYTLVLYTISLSWLLPLDGFKCIFLCRVYCVTVKTKNCHIIDVIQI